MGLNYGTALEIFNNPFDLSISIASPPEWKGKWGVALTRGPGHRFKVMLTTDNPEVLPNTKEEIIALVMKDIFRSSMQASREALSDPANPLGRILNPNGMPPSGMKNILTDEILARIESDLREKGVANTFEYADLMTS